MIRACPAAYLSGNPCDYVGLSTTPTVEMEVVRHQGKIIITASHNPQEWSLKLLEKGVS